MQNLLKRSIASETSSYPIIPARLGGSRSRFNPLNNVDVPRIEPNHVVSSFVVRPVAASIKHVCA